MSRWRSTGGGAGGDEAASQRTRDGWLGPRLALASGALFGLASLVNLISTRPSMLGVNAHVYYLAGEAVLAGGDLYAVAAPGFANLPYVYPPVVALAFVPYALLGSWQAAFAVHTVLAVASGLVLAWLLVALIEGDLPDGSLPRLDRVLISLFAVGSVHVVPSLYYGNVNPMLVTALAVGVVGVDRSTGDGGLLGGARMVTGGGPISDGRLTPGGRLAGVAFALPAVLKVFPALFGVWLLRLREWRAAGVAAATGLVAVVASLLAFGVSTHRAYLSEALLPRRRTALFVGGLPPEAPYLTIRRPLSVLFPGADPAVLALLAGLVLVPAAAYLLAADVGDGTGRLVALHGTVAAALLFFASYQTYFVFLLVTLVPLLYRLPRGRGRALFAAGAFVANLSVTLPTVAAALGPPLEGPALAALTPILTFGTPRLYGTLLTLLACVLYRRQGS